MNGKNSKNISDMPDGVTAMTRFLSHDTTIIDDPNDNAQEHTVQNFLLIWLDQCMDEINDTYYNIISQFRRVVNTIYTFTDADQCIDFLTEIKNEKVFMIISSTLGQTLVPVIHDISQLDSIYVLRKNHLWYEQWATEWFKVKGIFIQILSIIKALTEAIKRCEQDLISVNFLLTNNETSIQNLNQLDQSFMYTQLFKEILLEIDYDKQSIKNFTAYCHKQFSSKDIDLNIIDKFEQEYHLQSPIWWYTHAWFLYSMLNRALRTMEIDDIIKIGFFIRDLHQNITRLHTEQFGSNRTSSFIVYRGQGLSKMNFEKLMKTKGGLISFNNFLSTSTNRDVSLAFADSNRSNSDIIGILFKMTIDPEISSAPFAALDNASCFMTEQEILFSMHTVFRIDELKTIDDNQHIWQVELTLTSKKDRQLSIVTNCIRDEITGPTEWHSLANLLITLEQLKQAEELYYMLNNQVSDNRDKAYLYDQLGSIKSDQMDYEAAISFYNKALEIHEKGVPSNHFDLATAHNNIGSVYFQMKEYSKALSFYEQALEFHQKTMPPNHSDLMNSLNNIGSVYSRIGQFSKALSFHNKAIKIHQSSLRSNGLDLADCYGCIGYMYDDMKDYSKAVSFHRKALEIYENFLPSNHPRLAIFYRYISLMYFRISEYSKALSYLEKALEVHRRTLPSKYSSLSMFYNQIALVYDKMEEYSKALCFCNKALDIDENTLPLNHPDLASSYKIIGTVHFHMNKYSTALCFYEKALKIYQIVLAPDDTNLASFYDDLAWMYNKMEDYSKALAFLEKRLKICEKILLPNHPNLAECYKNIGILNFNISKYPTALCFYEKAHEIYQTAIPPNDFDLAASFGNIGWVYFKMCQYSKAFYFHEKVLEIHHTILPSNHPDLAESYNNLGVICEKMGELSRALRFFEKAFEIDQ